MKLLQIASMVPYPVDEGGRVVLYNTTKQFLNRGVEVHFACPRMNQNDSTGFSQIVPLHLLDIDPRTRLVGAVNNLFSSLPYNIEKYYSQSALQKLIKIATEVKFDAIHVDTLHMAQYGIELKRLFGIPIVLREHNFESDITRRFRDYSLNPFIRLYATMQHKRIMSFEANTVQQFDMVFPITNEDDAKLRLIAPRMRSTVISAGVDTRILQLSPNHISNKILFLINYDWPPNKDSLEYYIGQILPNVARLCPGVTTLLIGKGTEKYKRNAAVNNIEVGGYLQNLNDVSALGSIAIVPLRIGSGMRIKILELMAMGKVVITTSVGAEGIEAEHGRHLIVSDDPYEFATSIAHYLGSPEASARIGENARKLVEEKYSWDIVGKRMFEVYTSLVHASH